MNKNIPDAYLHLLETIAAQPDPFKGAELVAIPPMRGCGKAVDIMFIGRALNGWHRSFAVEDLRADLNKELTNILEDQHPSANPGDPLSWIMNHWSTGKEYNSARSQFLQVIRKVSEERFQKDQWWNEIVWTNFFKVAPSRANPTGKMIDVMGQASHHLLLAEIAYYKPRNIVCLSGLSYAAYLLASAETTVKVTTLAGSLLEYVGDISWADGRKIRMIIAPHPQSRSALRIADEIQPLLHDQK